MMLSVHSMYKNSLHTILTPPFYYSRHIHGDAGGEQPRVRLVPGEAVAVHGALLDGRLHGDDHPEHPVARAALRVEY